MIDSKKLIAIAWVEREIARRDIKISHYQVEIEKLDELIEREQELRLPLTGSRRHFEKQIKNAHRDLEILNTIADAML